MTKTYEAWLVIEGQPICHIEGITVLITEEYHKIGRITVS